MYNSREIRLRKGFFQHCLWLGRWNTRGEWSIASQVSSFGLGFLAICLRLTFVLGTRFLKWACVSMHGYTIAKNSSLKKTAKIFRSEQVLIRKFPFLRFLRNLGFLAIFAIVRFFSPTFFFRSTNQAKTLCPDRGREEKLLEWMHYTFPWIYFPRFSRFVGWTDPQNWGIGEFRFYKIIPSQRATNLIQNWIWVRPPVRPIGGNREGGVTP